MEMAFYCMGCQKFHSFPVSEEEGSRRVGRHEIIDASSVPHKVCKFFISENLNEPEKRDVCYDSVSFHRLRGKAVPLRLASLDGVQFVD